MRITYDKGTFHAVDLKQITHAQPFKFADDLYDKKLFIKVFSFNEYNHSIVSIKPGHCFIIELEEGGIQEVKDKEQVVLQEYELRTLGPLEQKNITAKLKRGA